VLPALLCGLLVGFDLTLAGPYTVYARNAGEYEASFWSLFPWLAAACLAVAGLVAGLILLVPRPLRGRALALGVSLGVASWIQGNFLLGDYGLLDGKDLEFAMNAGKGWLDGLLWLAVVAAGQLFQRRLRPHVVALAAGLLLVQATGAGLASPARASARSNAESVRPDDWVFSFSSGQNVVLLILDTITSDTFLKVVAEDRERCERAFEGFVFYEDATGAFNTTLYSVCAMLGAPAYENDIPLNKYLRRLRRETVNTTLLEAGYTVDWIALFGRFCQRGAHTNCWAIPRPYVPDDLRPEEREALHHRIAAAELVDISLFRHVPHTLKHRVYNAGRWTIQACTTPPALLPINASSTSLFFSDFIDSLRVERQAPTFKILHLGAGHAPYVLTPECDIVHEGSGDAAYEDQVRCAMRQTSSFLERLRELGILDDAMVVVTADHGASIGSSWQGTHLLSSELLSRARPMLAVKWPGRGGPPVRSRAPACLQDIAATIAAAAGAEGTFQGRDLRELDEDERRTRRIGFYNLRERHENGYLRLLERYSITGPSRDPLAWSFEGAVFAPDAELEPRIELGTRQGAEQLSSHGWSLRKEGAVTEAWSTGALASAYVAEPAGSGFELVARLRAAPNAIPLTVEVRLDGEPLGSWTLSSSEPREHSLALQRTRAGAVHCVSFSARPPAGATDEASGSFALLHLELRPVRN
jgi:hypothetical protein